MSFNKDNSNTYVGDHFAINLLKGDQHVLQKFNGERCRLLGFKADIRAFLNHQLTALVKYPGFYKVLSDPLVKLDNGLISQIPLMNLIPEGYRFTDRLLKNQLYLKEKRKHAFIAELPAIAYNIGDKVLVSKHKLIKEDFIGEVLDINIRGSGICYTMLPDDVVTDIHCENIIDIIEYGELSELERLGKLHRCYENLTGRRILASRYGDEVLAYSTEDD